MIDEAGRGLVMKVIECTIYTKYTSRGLVGISPIQCRNRPVRAHDSVILMRSEPPADFHWVKMQCVAISRYRVFGPGAFAIWVGQITTMTHRQLGGSAIRT